MIRKNLMKSLSVIMAAMLAVMTVACGKNTVDTTTAEVETVSEEAQIENSMVSASSIASTESEAGKVETVYVTADACGAVNDVIVSEWLKNVTASSELADATELKDIVNVKGSETFTDNGDGTLTWNAEGSDIYYQGTTDKDLPVKMNITYTLDGKEISPEELAGKSGRVTMRFEYENNAKKTVEVNGKDIEIYTPFAMVSGMMLDSDKFTNVEVSNGKVISDGGNYVVMGVATPGLKESLNISEEKWDELEDADEIKDKLSNSFEITADTVDFELGMTVTMASSDILSDFGMSDLSGSDKITDLKDDMGELNDGSNKLVDGTKTLKDGTKELRDGTKELYDGTTELSDGAVKLFDGSKELSDGTRRLYSGATELSDGTSKLYDGTGTLVDGTVSLKDGTKKLYQGVKAYTDGASQINDGAINLAGGAVKLKTGVDELNKSVGDSMLTNVKTLKGGALSIKDGTALLNTTLNTKAGELGQQLASYTAIESWLNDRGTLSVPGGVDESTFNACLSAVSGGQLSSVDAANYFMSNVNNAMDLINNVSTGTVTVSATTIPSGDGNESMEYETNTITNPEYEEEEEEENEEEKDKEEAAGGDDTDTSENQESKSGEDDKKDDLKQDNQGQDADDLNDEDKKSENVDDLNDEGKKSENAESEEENKGQAKNVTDDDDDENDADYLLGMMLQKGSVNDLSTLLLSLDETGLSTEDAASVLLNSTKTAVITKTEDTRPSFDAQKVAAAQQALGGYYQMLGSAKAAKAAVQSSVEMFTAVNPQTGMSLMSSINALANGAASLYAGTEQFETGINKLYAGTTALSQGAGDLSTGADKLATGTKALTAKNGELVDGASKLDSGAGKLGDGAMELKEGAGKLNSGAQQLTEGAGQLNSGANELSDGAGKLSDGAKELNDGAGKLNDGVIELDDGVQELLDGVIKLDKEGIKKLYEAFDGDLTEFADRITAIREAGDSYTTFGGSSEDVESSVKFIIKTDSIKSL